MTQRLDPSAAGGAPVLSIRLTRELAEALARETQRRSEAAGLPVSPTAVARALLERALREPAP